MVTPSFPELGEPLCLCLLRKHARKQMLTHREELWPLEELDRLRLGRTRSRTGLGPGPGQVRMESGGSGKTWVG